MSVHNGERFLREAVESVLAQTLADIELIVVDDGSTDSTAQILAAYAAQDSRLAVHRQSNQGSTLAATRAFALARAPLVAILDADDVAMPDRLERQHLFLTEHEKVAVVGGAVNFVDENGSTFAEVQYPRADAAIRESFEVTTPLANSAAMVRRNAYEHVGGYRSIFVMSHDLDMWLRLADSYELANLPEAVVRYRIHRSQETVGRLELQTLCAVAARVSRRARLAGRPDPLDAAECIDERTLLTHGASRAEITAAFVHSATWLAKTMERAGYQDAANRLWTEASARARSASGSRTLVAAVHRARATRHAERQQPVRAKLEAIRAVVAERGGYDRLR
jgi:Glycosyl transferase family 2